MVISIVIDCDIGHCYEHLKKNPIPMKIKPVTYIWIFCICDEFWAARRPKNEVLDFQAQPASGLFHPYFVSKSCSRVILMIKMVILDQSKAISLIF